MTNLPDALREMWKDVYVLYDTHYKMGNTVEAWDEYWNCVKSLTEKYADFHLWDLILVVTDMISDKMREMASMPTGG